MITATLLALVYLFAGALFARSVSQHITATAYINDDNLRMAVQLSAKSASMTIPMAVLALFWPLAAIYGLVSAALLDAVKPTYRVHRPY